MTASEAPQCAELPIALTDRVHLAFRRVAVGDIMSLAIKYYLRSVEDDICAVFHM